jgi:Protein of unknown function, DUF547
MKRAGSAGACAIVLTVLLSAVSGCGGKPLAAVDVPQGIDHREWTRLLRAYVDDRGLVDYGRWKASESDRRALRAYLAQFSVPATPPAVGAEKDASLTNAYNAFTVAWILDHYPTESIQAIKGSFTDATHRVGGKDVSLDDIEKATVVPDVGFRAHAVLVCAARSCPPLAREAYLPDRFAGQSGFAMLRWLARDDLNHFDAAARSAEISPIFRWNAKDFAAAKGGLRGVLSLYAPDAARGFVADPGTRIRYKDYEWGLNDQGVHGRNYGSGWWDRVKAKVGLGR